MEIAPGIHRIDTPLGNRVCALYLLAGRERALLVDTGVAGDVAGHVMPYLDEIGLDSSLIRLILISHSDVDHSGDTAAAVEAFPAALLACHRDDAAEAGDIEVMIEVRYGQFAADHAISDPPEATAWVRESGRSVPVHLALSGGERVRLEPGWEVELLHTPGHSRGHLTVWDPRSRAAVTADAVLGRTIATTEGEPAFPPTYRYVAPYRATIDLITALGPRHLLASHEPPMDEAAGRRFLAESRAFTDEAETAVLEVLRARGRLTTKPLLIEVGSRLGPWPVEAVLSALAFPIVGHLEELEETGRVRRGRDGDGMTTWEAIG